MTHSWSKNGYYNPQKCQGRNSIPYKCPTLSKCLVYLEITIQSSCKQAQTALILRKNNYVNVSPVIAVTRRFK